MKDSEDLILEEKAYLKVYRDSFDLNIRSAGANIQGYIVLPNKDIKTIKTNSTAKITLPIIDSSYIFMLINLDKNSDENIYTIGAGIEAPQIEFDFEDTLAHEPNDDEDSAKTILSNTALTNNQVISFLNYEDVDYWKIDNNNKITIKENNFKVLNLEPTATIKLDGEDSELFKIDENNSIVFKSAPDYEDPEDSDMDNIYILNLIENNKSIPIEVVVENLPTISDTTLKIYPLMKN